MKHSETDSQDGLEWTYDASQEVGMTRREKLREYYEEYLYKPGLVAWSDWRTRIGYAIVGLYLLFAVIAQFNLYRPPEASQEMPMLQAFQEGSAILGSNTIGQDILSLMIHATPEMLIMIVSGAVFAIVIAVLVGTFAGFKGGRVDSALMFAADVGMSIPGLPLVLVLTSTLRPTNPAIIGIIITINYWAGLSRAIRAQTLSIRENSYVEASRVMGVSTPRIMFKDIIPNLMPYITVNFVNACRAVIFFSVGLYYLGFLPYTNANWGVVLNNAYTQGAILGGSYVWLMAPIVMIMLLSLGLILIAQGMDRVFNPRVRTRLAGESESVEGDAEEGEVDTFGGAM
ncbi:ABC transporter permease [Halorhabdus salina]|uniref:ABC transporter permease n=1 Tax=Halorhabdus salina TaxID=2750670 RepID=UPI002867EBE2|nr:ABC transporter permease [Halorhabdus salina]